jgi:hypothetical protein
MLNRLSKEILLCGQGSFMHPLKWFLAVIVTLLLAGGLEGQQNGSNIAGTIPDPTGAVVSDAQVSAIQIATGQISRTKSNVDGFYVIPNLPPGEYRLECEKTGFRSYAKIGLNFLVGQVATINIEMKLGSQAETVTVSDVGSSVDVRTQSLTTSIGPEFARELPLDGRNTLQLLLTSPEVSPATTSLYSQSGTRPESKSTFASASGGRSNTTSFYLDGAPNEDSYTSVANAFPNPDALQEFSYTTNNASAKFETRGGGVVNALTRSGTNRFHGTVFEFYRDHNLNALNYFATQDDGQQRNQYGFSVGGPIRKDKTFFFLSWQKSGLESLPSTNVTATPTAAMLQGDFSAIPTQLVDPNTGVPFAGNQIDPTLFDPLAVKVLSLVPLSDSATGLTSFTLANNQHDNQWTGRLDNQFGEKFHLYGRYLYDRLEQVDPTDPANYLTASGGHIWKSQNFVLHGDYAAKSNLTGDFAVSYNRLASDRNGPTGLLGWTELGANVPNNHPGGADKATTMELAVDGYFGIDWGAYQRIPRSVYSATSSWTYISGKHTVEFGGEVTLDRMIVTQDNLAEGFYEFGNQFSGDNLVDFMLGRPSLFLQSAPIYDYLKRTKPAVFLSDIWKPARKFSVSLGVRWDPWIPFTDAAGAQTHEFSQAAYNAGITSTRYPLLPPGLLLGGDPGIPKSVIRSDFTVFDPRVGVAYDVFGNGRTSVRAGFGIYHDSPIGVMNNDQLSIPPFGFTASFSPPASLVDPYSGQVNPFPITTPAPPTLVFPTPFAVEAFDPRLSQPTTQQWNLTLEQQLPKSFMMRVAYEGAEAYHLLGAVQANAAVYIPGGSTLANVQNRRPKQEYSGITLSDSIGTSSFNALSVSMQKTAGHGLTLLTGFRWAKNLDDLSKYNGNGSTYTATNIQIDRGLSDNDIDKQFTLSYVWKIPTATALGAFGKYVLGGWQTTGIFTARTGLPYSVLSGSNYALDGISGDRAALIGDPSLPSDRPESAKLQEWFNTSAFAPNPAGVKLGGLRNKFRGPAYTNLDFGLTRSLALPFGPWAETQRVEFRFEAFNFLNHPNFANPGSTLGSPSFGIIQTANTPRVLQVAVKYAF